MLAAASDAFVVDLDTDDAIPVAGEHLRDARTHGAQSHNADGLEFACHVGILARAERPSVVCLLTSGATAGSAGR